MFGFRTPAKAGKSTDEVTPPKKAGKATHENELPNIGMSNQATSVRKSIGEWESVKPDIAKSAEPQKLKPSKAPPRRQSEEIPISPIKQARKYTDRLAEARACAAKAKLHLGNSRNLKTEIKTEVLAAVDRLYLLVKELEAEKGKKLVSKPERETEEHERETRKPEMEAKQPEGESSFEKVRKENNELMKRIEEHTRVLKENTDKIDKLQETLEKQTYASAAAAFPRRQPVEQTALHSVVVTAKDETETGEEVLNRIRKAVNAKEGWVTVERIRKAKDRKVIVGCRNEEERQKLKERLKKSEEHLNVEEIKNKDPLIIFKDVLQYNSDEDILSALRNQNRNLFKDLEDKDSNVEIAYKKRTRNPQTAHIVMRVSPKLWQRIVEEESVHIDLQRVKVADQSPLVQCSLCLGYGHGRRFCKETQEKCSHCGGPHMRTECADWLAREPPTCCNCSQAKADHTNHNAFSQECPIRRKWEALARATTAYC